LLSVTNLSRHLRGSWFVARAMPGVRPGGRPTFLCGQESRQRNRPCKTGPSGCLAMLGTQGRGELAPLRSAQTGAASQFLKCASRTPWVPALLSGFEGERQTAQQPTAKPASRPVPAARYAPFSTAEQRRGLRARAQLASTTDSAQLFEQSVAARVLRGPSRPEQRRAPVAKRRAGRSGGSLCLLSSGPESRSPARAKTEGFAEGKSPHGPCHQPNPGKSIARQAR
jgi:hypothetical protein